MEGSAKYDILVKLIMNDKEEKYKANVHKDNDGKFHVNNMKLSTKRFLSTTGS